MNSNIANLLDELSMVGVCPTGKRYLNGVQKDMNTLVKIWRKWPEYFCEHSGYALTVMRKYLTPKDIGYLASIGLLVDFKKELNITIDNCTEPMFAIGNSECTINATDYCVLKVYAFNSAKVDVRCSNNAYAMIELYDSSVLTAEVDVTSKCKVYQYDNSQANGNATVAYKNYIRGSVFNGKEALWMEIY